MKHDIRIVVPLKWESTLRKSLFEELKKLGYTWSQGDSLDIDRENLHRMAYLAIYIDQPVVRFSSNPEIINKPISECGYNYIIHGNLTLDNIMKSLKYVKSLSSDLQDTYNMQGLVENHYRLKDFFVMS